VRHGKESRGGTEPGHEVVAAAGAKTELAHDGLADHDREDRENEKRREVSRGVVEKIEEAAHWIPTFAGMTFAQLRCEGHILR